MRFHTFLIMHLAQERQGFLPLFLCHALLCAGEHARVILLLTAFRTGGGIQEGLVQTTIHFSRFCQPSLAFGLPRRHVPDIHPAVPCLVQQTEEHHGTIVITGIKGRPRFRIHGFLLGFLRLDSHGLCVTEISQ